MVAITCLYIFGIAVATLAVIAHIIGLWILFSIKSGHTNQNIIMKNFSVFSLISCAMLLFRGIYVYVHHKENLKTAQLYEATNGMFLSAGVCYVILLFFLSIDRLIAILYPLKYRALYSPAICHRCMLATWLLCLVILVIFTAIQNRQIQIYGYYATTCFVSILLIFIAITYGKIFQSIRKSNVKVTSEQTYKRKSKHVVVPFVIVVVMMVFYVVPSLVLLLFHQKLSYLILAGTTLLTTSLGILLDGVVYVLFPVKTRNYLCYKLNRCLDLFHIP